MADNSLPYYKQDSNMDEDPKFQYIVDKEGDDVLVKRGDYAELLWLRFLRKCNRTDGYYIKWDKTTIPSFMKRVAHDTSKTELVNEIVEDMLDIGLFDRAIFEKYSVLTSKSMQSRWMVAKNASHSDFDLVKEYWLLDKFPTEHSSDAKRAQSGRKADAKRALSGHSPDEDRALSGQSTTVELGEERRGEERKGEDTLSSAGACETKFSDEDAMRVVGVWNDVFQGTDQFYDAINVNQITLFRIKQRLERGTSDEEFRRVFEKAKNRTDFGWTLPMVFNKEDNFDQIRARKESHNNSPVRESGYSDQRNYNHLYSAKGTDEPLPARYTEEVTI